MSSRQVLVQWIGWHLARRRQTRTPILPVMSHATCSTMAMIISLPLLEKRNLRSYAPSIILEAFAKHIDNFLSSVITPWLQTRGFAVNQHGRLRRRRSLNE